MAGQNHNEETQKDITNNGIEPVNQNEDENNSEEYDTLDSTLDELNTALDFLEQKNDNIHVQLQELLQSNIEIRQELQKEKTDTSANN
ncbi:Uncharacterized protein OBRU01_04961 [Operophtera brumata]|uniref:Uncharacterized protein n=1 Tax=Operophtera brumata TaxID=104452 RepID=A0A0L7LN73_OPEBR|nr:Uncharacterized protein OBRU01_04961 [Operophtera brumata]